MSEQTHHRYSGNLSNPRQVPNYVTLGHPGAIRKWIFAGLRPITGIHSYISIGFRWESSGRVSSLDNDERVLCAWSGLGIHPVGCDIPQAIVRHVSHKHRTKYKLYFLIYRFEMWTTAWDSQCKYF